MKKPLITVVALGCVIGVGVVILGATQGWFTSRPSKPEASAKKPKPVSKRPPIQREDPEKFVTTQGLERLKSLEKAKPAQLAEGLKLWARQKGIERKVSWEAVRVGVGAGAGRKRDTRLRACRLARALARKPEDTPIPPPADPRAVAPLLTCLWPAPLELIQFLS